MGFLVGFNADYVLYMVKEQKINETPNGVFISTPRDMVSAIPDRGKEIRSVIENQRAGRS
jgi:uncharacterized protein (DUF2461 family)